MDKEYIYEVRLIVDRDALAVEFADMWLAISYVRMTLEGTEDVGEIIIKRREKI